MHCAKCFFYDSDVGDEVCERCGRAFLPEANVYLGLLLLATGGLAYTLKLLLTGQPALLARPTLDVGAWATYPVSLVDAPAYGIIMGAWLAMLAAAPIMAAVMYGKRGGWLLCLFVALLGPSVTLAAVAALGVWIAGGHTLRMNSKIASGLLGLVPNVTYWYVVAARSDVPALGTGLDSMRYVAPVFATVVAPVAVVLVVLVGQADRWHVRWPGAAAAVLVFGPVIALVTFVGVDRVRYEMLPDPSTTAEPALVASYREFLRRHPDGPVAARVRAQLATVLTEARFRQGPIPADWPSPALVWHELVDRAPEDPWAVDARLHLADAAAADGLFDEADRLYREVLRRTGGVVVPPDDPVAEFSVLVDLFSVGDQIRVRETARRLQQVRHTAMLRYGLLRDNRHPETASAKALARFFVALGLKGTDRFLDALREAGAIDPAGPLADNVEARLAQAEPDDAARAAALVAVAEKYPDTDGAMRARLWAAEAMTTGQAEPEALARARDLLVQVRAALEARRKVDPEDPYAMALVDQVEKKIAYVQAQLRTPENGK